MSKTLDADVIVVGAGNAAACAAFAARDAGARVIMLEAAPKDERGGNSTYTAGAMRTVYSGAEDVVTLVPDLSEAELASMDFGSYSEEQFFDDMYRVTRYRTDPDLTEVLVKNSLPTLQWMRKQGVKFQTSQGRQAFKVDGKFKFWGGLCVEIWGGGPGLVDMEHAIAEKKGIDIRYETTAVSLIQEDGVVVGVKVRHQGKTSDLRGGAVVLAAGGFESNAEMRTRYLGPGWDLAKVRGTRYNTGGGINMALAVGAMPYGHWSGCHAVGWDQNAPPFGDLSVGDNFQKHSYPLGIMVNARGERFVDEGADFRNYTYAKYGHVILQQPDMFAWQIFDKKVLHMLRDEYRIRRVTKVSADTLEELVTKLEGVDAARALETIKAYNAAVMTDVAFNPTVKDGRGTRGLTVPKTNWANVLDEPPFEAYAVTCGVTFTFGGLKISTVAEVEDTGGTAIPGLYAAGELVGGIFYHNYPGGTGLTNGAVFGKIAGDGAAAFALGKGQRGTG
ncbi:MAG: FAD-dependent tricarballylate dehydrogenase TcuA [Hyphomicrobiaceae bacterium]